MLPRKWSHPPWRKMQVRSVSHGGTALGAAGRETTSNPTSRPLWTSTCSWMMTSRSGWITRAGIMP
jgi:hypothetical protein